jgi:hypothetical protein
VEQKGLFKKGFTPSGEDPAYYPVVLLNELNDFIVNRDEIKNNPGSGQYAAIGEQWAPMKETLRIIKTAYEIIAYPFCREEGRRYAIESELGRDQHSFDRRSVELNDTELGMLRKLAAARGLPCDSEKRVYEYSEVLSSSPSAKPLVPQN